MVLTANSKKKKRIFASEVWGEIFGVGRHVNQSELRWKEKEIYKFAFIAVRKMFVRPAPS